MGQQPNLEIGDAEKPRTVPHTPPARRWRPTRPGMITSPQEQPSGGRFGMIGPDPGWALRIVNLTALPDDDPALPPVLGALMTARAAATGRAPSRQDLEAALILCGYGFDAPEEVVARRRRWLDAVRHEVRPGETAVAEVDRGLLVSTPDQIQRSILVNARLGPGN